MKKISIKIIGILAIFFVLTGCGDSESGSSTPDTFTEYTEGNTSIQSLVSNRTLYVYGYDKNGVLANSKYFVMHISEDGTTLSIVDINDSENIIIEETQLLVYNENNKSIIEFEIPNNLEYSKFSVSVLDTDDNGIYVKRTIESLRSGVFPITGDPLHTIDDGMAFPYIFSYKKQDDNGKKLLEDYGKSLLLTTSILRNNNWYGIEYGWDITCREYFHFTSDGVEVTGGNIDDNTYSYSVKDDNILYHRDVANYLIAREDDMLIFKAILEAREGRGEGYSKGLTLFKNRVDADSFMESFNLAPCNY